MSAVAHEAETQMPEPIIFTDSAAAKVADLIAEEGNPELKPVSYTHLTLPTIYSV